MKIKSYWKKYNDIWNGIRDKIKDVSSDGCDYQKVYMKIKFNSDDNLPLNKPLKFGNMTITIRSVFEEGGKLYSQVVLDDTLYELNVSIFFITIYKNEWGHWFNLMSEKQRELKEASKR